jgi:hypothetical protein
MKTWMGAVFGVLFFVLFCLALTACGRNASDSFASGNISNDALPDDIVISGDRILLLDGSHSDLYASIALPRNLIVEIDANLRNTAVTLVARRFDSKVDIGIATIAGADGERPNIPAGEIGRLITSNGNGADRHISVDAALTTVDTLSASRIGDEIVLSWSERNTGDYDNNGDVGIADITPIAQHYLHEVGTDAEDVLIDGSMSGQVGIEDITPIAQNYLSSVLGYNVYRNGVYLSGAGVATVMRPDPGSVAPESRYPLKYTFHDSPAPAITTTYTYGVRPMHDGGAVGSPSNTVDIEYVVETNPPPTISPPGNVNAFEENGRLTISWSAPPEPEVTGYNLYYSASPFADKAGAALANATPLPKFQLAYIFDAPLNVRQYFRLTSVADTVEWGVLESDLSAQADAMVEDSEAPPIPILESLEQVEMDLKATWGAVSAPDLVGYRVYYSTESFVEVVEATELTTEPITATEFSFTAPTRFEYFVRVTSVDAAGNESQPSNMRSAFLNEGFWAFTNVTGGMWYFGMKSLFIGTEGKYFVAVRPKDEFNARHNVTIVDGRTDPPTTFEIADTLDTNSVVGGIGGPGEVGYVFVVRDENDTPTLRIVNDDGSFEQSLPMIFNYINIYPGQQDDSGNPVFPIHGTYGYADNYAGWLRWNSSTHEFEFVTAMVDGVHLEIRETMGFEWVSDERILILANLESDAVHLYEFDESGIMTKDILEVWPGDVERPLMVHTQDGITNLYIDDLSSGQGFKVYREDAPGADTYTMTMYDPPNSFVGPSHQTISPEGYPCTLGTTKLTWFTGSEFIEETTGIPTSLDLNGGDYVTFDDNGIPGFAYSSDATGLWIARRNAPLG